MPPLVPPPAPGSGATATPTATATATATATPVPLILRLRLAHRVVSPRSKQKIVVTTLPGTYVDLTVRFPNGGTKEHDGTAGEAGTLTWSYRQPGSRITRKSRTARVTVVAGEDDQTLSAEKRYTIGFAALDVSVQPRVQFRGRAITISVHTQPSSRVGVVLRFRNGSTAQLQGHDGGDGWWDQQYVVPNGASRGRVDVRGWGVSSTGSSRNVSGVTSFRVR